MPEHMDKITWSPPLDESLNDLDYEWSKTEIARHRVIRYSLQLQTKETGTIYRIKLWASQNMLRKGKNKVWSLSSPIDREPLYTPQSISQSLANDFRLDEYAGNIAENKTINALQQQPVSPGVPVM